MVSKAQLGKYLSRQVDAEILHFKYFEAYINYTSQYLTGCVYLMTCTEGCKSENEKRQNYGREKVLNWFKLY